MQNIRLRQLLSVLLVTIAFLFSSSFISYNSNLTAKATTLTPEAEQYHTEGGEDFQNTVKKAEDSGKNFLEKTTENIVEKLNLNEPIPPATKEFFQGLDNTEETVSNPLKDE